MSRVLHRSEKEIIRVLFRENRPMSIHEIAEESGMSWVTAKKYIAQCEKRRIIAPTKYGNSTAYEIDNDLLKELYKRR